MQALCVVAKPLAAARAARRLCDAQGGILFGPAVATLDRIVPQILAAAGDRRPVLPPLAERLLAVRAGRAAGGPFAGLAADGGLAASLTTALAELRRGEVDAESARAAAARLAGGPAVRLGALADALAAYEEALRELSVLDRPGATRVAAAAARRGALPADLRELDLLVVDGVHAASPAEWDLLAALAGRARRARFHLPFFPERADACAAAEPLLRRVEALHEEAARRELEVVLPHVEGDGRAPRVAALLAALGGGHAPGRLDGEGLVVAEPGAGEAGEIATLARVLARLLEAGFAPGDVALVAPSPRRLAPALAAACAEAGIPLATGRGPALVEAPPVALILDALGAAPALDRTQAERLAASTYLALPPLPGELGALLDRSGALDGRGAPAAALRRRAAALASASAARERSALVRAADGLDALAALVRPLAGGGTVRAHAARLAAFVDAAGIRRRAGRGPRDVAGRDLAALSALDDALEQLARAVALAGRGAEVLAPAELRALTLLALEGAALPPPPEPAAGAVELWGLDEAPGLSARAVVLAGCARGGWPPPSPPDPLLREPERQAVNAALRRAALPVAAARRAESTFRAFSAAAAGREAVAFVWPAPGPAGDGGPLAPLVSDALAALGVEPAPLAPEPSLGAARTVREALRAAARDPGRSARVLAATPLGLRARQVLERGVVEAVRRTAVVRRRSSAWAGLVRGPALAVLRAALPREWSPSQLEEWARCPFRLLLRLGVRLDEPGEEGLDIEVREEGSLLHAVLERFVRARAGRRAWPPAGDPADLAEARAAAAEVFADFERAGRIGDPSVWTARRETVLARLDRIVRAEAEGPTDVTPVLLEHAFGGRSGRPALELSAGGEVVRLRGRIDRVDAGPSRLLVLDYKSSKGSHGEKLDPESFGETSFQIPAYLLAAARELPGRPRLDATYAVLRTAERLPAVELEAGDPRLAAAATARATAPPAGEGEGPGRSFAAAVVEVVGAVRRGGLAIASRTCAYCAYGAVCRFEGAAARDDEQTP